MFIETYYVRLEIKNRALMEFLAVVPADVYCLIAPAMGGSLFGVIISNDAIEYLLNECGIDSLSAVERETVVQTGQIMGSRRWGNEELLNL